MASKRVVTGRYELMESIGSGGMGTVYRARDRVERRDVAVKVSAGGVDPARFDREVSVLRRVSHDAVVPYLDHGVTDIGERFLVMEWVDGISVRDLLAARLLSVHEVLELGRRVASALAAVHHAGILHRDLKPHNIVLPEGRAARAKVIDFGIALDANTLSRLTAPGAVLGTWTYMSPEQATVGAVVDARSDLYALGCVLFACLTGGPPCGGDRLAALLRSILWETPPHVRTLRDDVPDALDMLIARLLEKAPCDRPASAGTLLALLDQLDAPDTERVPERVRGLDLNAPLAALLGASSADEQTARDTATTQRELGAAVRLTEEAMVAGQFTLAEHYAECALLTGVAGTARQRMLRVQAEAIAWQARWSSAAAAAERAIDAADDAAERCRATAVAAHAAVRLGELERLERLCDTQPRDAFERGPDALAALAELAELSVLCSSAGSKLIVNRVATRRDASDDRVRATMCIVRATHALGRGDVPSAVRLRQQALEHSIKARLGWRAALIACDHAAALVMAGDVDAATVELEQLSALCANTDVPLLRMRVSAVLVLMHLVTGDLESARAQVIDLTERVQRASDRYAELLCSLDRCAIELERGDRSQAAIHGARALDLAASFPHARGAALAFLSRAYLQAGVDDAAARTLSSALSALLRERWSNERRIIALVHAIEAAQSLGDAMGATLSRMAHEELTRASLALDAAQRGPFMRMRYHARIAALAPA